MFEIEIGLYVEEFIDDTSCVFMLDEKEGVRHYAKY